MPDTSDTRFDKALARLEALDKQAETCESRLGRLEASGSPEQAKGAEVTRAISAPADDGRVVAKLSQIEQVASKLQGDLTSIQEQLRDGGSSGSPTASLLEPTSEIAATAKANSSVPSRFGRVQAQLAATAPETAARSLPGPESRSLSDRANVEVKVEESEERAQSLENRLADLETKLPGVLISGSPRGAEDLQMKNAQMQEELRRMAEALEKAEGQYRIVRGELDNLRGLTLQLPEIAAAQQAKDHHQDKIDVLDRVSAGMEKRLLELEASGSKAAGTRGVSQPPPSTVMDPKMQEALNAHLQIAAASAAKGHEANTQKAAKVNDVADQLHKRLAAMEQEKGIEVSKQGKPTGAIMEEELAKMTAKADAMQEKVAALEKQLKVLEKAKPKDQSLAGMKAQLDEAGSDQLEVVVMDKAAEVENQASLLDSRIVALEEAYEQHEKVLDVKNQLEEAIKSKQELERKLEARGGPNGDDAVIVNSKLVSRVERECQLLEQKFEKLILQQESQQITMTERALEPTKTELVVEPLPAPSQESLQLQQENLQLREQIQQLQQQSKDASQLSLQLRQHEQDKLELVTSLGDLKLKHQQKDAEVLQLQQQLQQSPDIGQLSLQIQQTTQDRDDLRVQLLQVQQNAEKQLQQVQEEFQMKLQVTQNQLQSRELELNQYQEQILQLQNQASVQPEPVQVQDPNLLALLQEREEQILQLQSQAQPQQDPNLLAMLQNKEAECQDLAVQVQELAPKAQEWQMLALQVQELQPKAVECERLALQVRELEPLAQECQRLSLQVQQLQSKADECNQLAAELNQLKVSQRELPQKELQAKEGQIAQLQQQLQQLQQAHSDVTGTARDSEAQARKLSLELNQVKLQAQLDVNKFQADASRVPKLEQTCQELEQREKAYRADADALRMELATLRASASSSIDKAEVDKIRQALSAANSEKATLQIQITDYRSKSNEVSRNFEAMQQENLDLTRKLTQMTEGSGQSIKTIELLENRLRDEQANAAIMKQQLELEQRLSLEHRTKFEEAQQMLGQTNSSTSEMNQVKGILQISYQTCGSGIYRVDNTQLQATTIGLNYRATKVLEDKLTMIAAWGTLVPGIDEGDGWIKVGSYYLPTAVQGIPVLSPSLPQITESTTSVDLLDQLRVHCLSMKDSLATFQKLAEEQASQMRSEREAFWDELDSLKRSNNAIQPDSPLKFATEVTAQPITFPASTLQGSLHMAIGPPGVPVSPTSTGLPNVSVISASVPSTAVETVRPTPSAPYQVPIKSPSYTTPLLAPQGSGSMAVQQAQGSVAVQQSQGSMAVQQAQGGYVLPMSSSGGSRLSGPSRPVAPAPKAAATSAPKAAAPSRPVQQSVLIQPGVQPAQRFQPVAQISQPGRVMARRM